MAASPFRRVDSGGGSPAGAMSRPKQKPAATLRPDPQRAALQSYITSGSGIFGNLARAQRVSLLAQGKPDYVSGKYDFREETIQKAEIRRAQERANDPVNRYVKPAVMIGVGVAAATLFAPAAAAEGGAAAAKSGAAASQSGAAAASAAESATIKGIVLQPAGVSTMAPGSAFTSTGFTIGAGAGAGAGAAAGLSSSEVVKGIVTQPRGVSTMAPGSTFTSTGLTVGAGAPSLAQRATNFLKTPAGKQVVKSAGSLAASKIVGGGGPSGPTPARVPAFNREIPSGGFDIDPRNLRVAKNTLESRAAGASISPLGRDYALLESQSGGIVERPGVTSRNRIPIRELGGRYPTILERERNRRAAGSARRAADMLLS